MDALIKRNFPGPWTFAVHVHPCVNTLPIDCYDKGYWQNTFTHDSSSYMCRYSWQKLLIEGQWFEHDLSIGLAFFLRQDWNCGSHFLSINPAENMKVSARVTQRSPCIVARRSCTSGYQLLHAYRTTVGFNSVDRCQHLLQIKQDTKRSGSLVNCNSQ